MAASGRGGRARHHRFSTPSHGPAESMSLRDIVWTSSGFFVTTSRTNIVYSATGAPNSWGAYYSRTEQALYGLVWAGSKVLAAGSGGTILAIRGSLSVFFF